jgi:hypothetical protein
MRSGHLWVRIAIGLDRRLDDSEIGFYARWGGMLKWIKTRTGSLSQI